MRPAAAGVRHATFLANAVLAGLIGFAAADLVWRALPVDNPSPPPVIAGGAGGGNTGTASDTGENLAGMHMMGRAAPLDADTGPQTPVDAPETRLNLSLRGLLYHPQQQQALAIIGQGDSKETFYRVGDELPGGASVNAIHTDRVILLRNGRHETLTLPAERLDLEAAASPELPAAGTDGRNGGDNAGGASGQLAETRRELMSNPAQFSQYVQIEPHTEDGNFVGYRLQPGRNPSLMQEAGLEPGDIVVSIAGTRLTSPEAGMQAMQRASRQASLQLEVIRNGNPQTIHIDMSD